MNNRHPQMISSLHNVCDDNSSWNQFADKTADFFNADGCLFSLREIKRPDSPVAVGIAKLEQKFALQLIATTSKSPFYHKLKGSPVGSVVLNNDVGDKLQIELADYFANVLSMERTDEVMGGIVYRDEKYEASISIARHGGTLGSTPQEALTFSAKEQLRFQDFLRDIGMMVEFYVQNHLTPREHEVSRVIAHLAQSAAVIDINGAILHSNSGFDKLKHSKQLLYTYADKVNFYNKDVQRWFEKILDNHNKNVVNGALNGNTSVDDPTVYRLKHDDTSTIIKLDVFDAGSKNSVDKLNPRFILSVDYYDTDWLATRYKVLFCLTNAEAELATEIFQGKTLNQLAIDKDLSKHTLRTQLKSVFNKTDTHSQNELIVLLKNVV